MKRLRLLKEPLQPTPVKPNLSQLLHPTSLIHPRVMRKLCPLNESKDDCILKTDEHGADALEREWVAREEVLLHSLKTEREEWECLYAEVWEVQCEVDVCREKGAAADATQ